MAGEIRPGRKPIGPPQIIGSVVNALEAPKAAAPIYMRRRSFVPSEHLGPGTGIDMLPAPVQAPAPTAKHICCGREFKDEQGLRIHRGRMHRG